MGGGEGWRVRDRGERGRVTRYGSDVVGHEYHQFLVSGVRVQATAYSRCGACGVTISSCIYTCGKLMSVHMHACTFQSHP